MPPYKNSPPAESIMVEQGSPVYLFGSRQSIDSQLSITSVSVATNVATIGVTSWSGPLPVVGAFVSIDKSQTNGGIFNVTNAPITGVALNAAGTDIVSLSFALTSANIGVITDVGTAHVRFAAIGESFSSSVASIAGSVGNVVGRQGNWFSAQVNFSTIPTAATIALQGSNINNDADFQDIQAITVTSGRGEAQIETSFEFVRFNITGVTGTGAVVATVNA